jgi:uncharacterized protein involved in type VI secretion and phage assembly
MMGFDGGSAAFAPGLTRAVVRANEDPEKLGRVRVEYPAFHGDSASTPSEWARVCLPYASNGHGYWLVPDVGDEVLVVFENGNLDHPIVLGTLYSGAKKPPTAGRPGDGTAEVRFLKTKSGHLLCFDDAAGEGRVTLQDRDGRKLEIDSSKRSVTVTDGAGHVLSLEPDTVTLKHKSGDSVTLRGSEVVIQSAGKVSLGEGAAQALVLGDAFLNLFNAHTHVVGPSMSTPPVTPMTPSMLSQKVKTV